jgi:hypothetical protein
MQEVEIRTPIIPLIHLIGGISSHQATWLKKKSSKIKNVIASQHIINSCNKWPRFPSLSAPGQMTYLNLIIDYNNLLKNLNNLTSHISRDYKNLAKNLNNLTSHL